MPSNVVTWILYSQICDADIDEVYIVAQLTGCLIRAVENALQQSPQLLGESEFCSVILCYYSVEVCGYSWKITGYQ